RCSRAAAAAAHEDVGNQRPHLRRAVASFQPGSEGPRHQCDRCLDGGHHRPKRDRGHRRRRP
ncbi:hypothetical protein BN1723_020844, partial [Verticillium longisporum]